MLFKQGVSYITHQHRDNWSHFSLEWNSDNTSKNELLSFTRSDVCENFRSENMMQGYTELCCSNKFREGLVLKIQFHTEIGEKWTNDLFLPIRFKLVHFLKSRSEVKIICIISVFNSNWLQSSIQHHYCESFWKNTNNHPSRRASLKFT